MDSCNFTGKANWHTFAVKIRMSRKRLLLFIVVDAIIKRIVCLTIESLGMEIARLDCLQLVFFRRLSPLIARHQLYHKGRLWLVHFDPPNTPLLGRVAVPSAIRCCTVFLLLCILIVDIHASGISIPLSLLMLLG